MEQRSFEIEGSEIRFYGRVINALLVDVSERIGSSPQEIGALIGAETLVKKAAERPNDTILDKGIWPLLKFALEHDLWELLPANGIPPFTYEIDDKAKLDSRPFGVELHPTKVDLERRPCKLGGYDIDFPLCLPASIISMNSSWLQFYAERGFSILTYKTVRSKYRAAHQHPSWVFIDNPHELDPGKRGIPETLVGRPGYYPDDTSRVSMANSFGVPSHSHKAWKKDVSKIRSKLGEGQVLIVSVVGSDPTSGETLISDFKRTACEAEDSGAQILELNFSCPNTRRESGNDPGSIYQDPTMAASILSSVKDAVDIPVFAKIGYLSYDDLRSFLKLNGPLLDGITAINTISAKIVSKPGGENTFPGSDRKEAGVSGWAIKNAAQEVAENLIKIRNESKEEFDIIGLGGVMNKTDFEERIATGVEAVGICTGAFFNANIASTIRFDRKSKTNIIEDQASSTDSATRLKGSTSRAVRPDHSKTKGADMEPSSIKSTPSHKKRTRIDLIEHIRARRSRSLDEVENERKAYSKAVLDEWPEEPTGS